MNNTIKDYYENHKTPSFLLKQKMRIFDKHKDIAREFEEWIKSGKYKTIGSVSVEGYTAKKLAETSKYLNGEGAFMMLIELRENPERAQKKIKQGFMMK